MRLPIARSTINSSCTGMRPATSQIAMATRIKMHRPVRRPPGSSLATIAPYIIPLLHLPCTSPPVLPRLHILPCIGSVQHAQDHISSKNEVGTVLHLAHPPS
ncbi:unnamed protein product [Cercospora beticola]|nr:unnamed protein product [Cercospora beticola]